MSDISRLLSLATGFVRGVDISAAANALVVGNLKYKGSTSGFLTQNAAAATTSYSITWPAAQAASAGYVLSNDGAGVLSWVSAAAGSALDGTFRILNTSDNTKQLAFDASGIATGTTRTIIMPNANVDLGNLTNSNISASAAIAYSKLNLSASIVNADINAAAAIAYTKLALTGSIVNADINASAAIAYTKLAALTANRALQSDGSGFVSVSAVTATELGYVSGVTSAIQTQLSHKIQDDGSVPFAANQPMGSHKLTGLSAGTGAGDSVRYEQAILVSGANAFAANQSMGGNKITNAADPSSPQDYGTKFYIDNLVAGLSWKTYARAASVANINLASLPAAIDGVTMVTGNRFLAKNQTAPAENGIYVYTSAGAAATRATDMDSWAEVVGAVLLVSEGSVNAGSKWVNTNIDGGTFGTDPITFTAFSIAGTVNGTGTSGYVAYWNGTASLTAEQYLSTIRGGTGGDSSAASGIAHVSAGTWSYSLIVNADVSGSAAIAYSKLNLSASIVNADINGSAAIAYSKLALTNSIVLGDLTSNSVDENKIVSTSFSASGAVSGGSGSKIAWLPDNSSLEISSNAARIKTTAYDQLTITGGGGSAAAVAYAPKFKRVLVAGQAFAADTSFIVRWALNGETAGRVYKTDSDTTSNDLFYAIGIGYSLAGVSAGGNLQVTSLGTYTLGGSDTPFSSGDVGKPVFLGSAGAFSTTAPTTAGFAITRVGIVQSTTSIDVSPTPVGVN